MEKERILIVIPVYNCEKQIPRVLLKFDSRVLSYINTILVINNMSTDSTEHAAISVAEKIKEVNFVLLRNSINYGYGGSLKIGFEFALKYSFDYVIVINGDDQSSITDFIPLLQFKKYRPFDVMWGSRFMRSSSLVNYSFLRIIANYVFNLLFSLATGKYISDIGCGVYMYSVRALKDRFYFKLPDVLYIGSYQRLIHDFCKHKIQEFPIKWSSEDESSSVKVFSQTIAQFKLAFQYLVNKKKFAMTDHRVLKRDKYVSEIIYSAGENKNFSKKELVFLSKDEAKE